MFFSGFGHSSEGERNPGGTRTIGGGSNDSDGNDK